MSHLCTNDEFLDMDCGVDDSLIEIGEHTFLRKNKENVEKYIKKLSRELPFCSDEEILGIAVVALGRASRASEDACESYQIAVIMTGNKEYASLCGL